MIDVRGILQKENSLERYENETFVGNISKLSVCYE